MDAKINFHGGDAESGDVFMVETHAPAGYKLTQHSHEKPHLSYLASGRAGVEVDGVCVDHIGPCVLTIAAHKVHAVYARTDITWLCLWAGDEEIEKQARGSLKLLEGV
jgi:hypothetical protein